MKSLTEERDSRTVEEIGGTGRVMEVDDTAEQMPLGMITGAGASGITDDPFASEAKSKSSGALLLIVVLIVAGGTLWAMRMAGGIESDKTNKAAETKIDEVLAKLASDKTKTPVSADSINALFRDADSVATLFAQDPTKNQVDLGHLQKNPFELFVSRPADGGKAAGSSTPVVDKARIEMEKQLTAEFGKLKLQSLLNGKQSLAMIGGKVIREGDTLGSFHVDSISPYGVQLSAQGMRFALTMENNASNNR